MNLPGVPWAIPVPVAHNDSPPVGVEALLFSSTPANEWDEHWVGIDVPTAQRLGHQLLAAMQDAAIVPWLGP